MNGSADPQRSRSLELQVFRKDGSSIWVENSMSFLRDPQGKPIGVLAVSKDISERKRAEREQKKLLDIIDQSLNEIYLFDAVTLKFEYVNTGALRNIGYPLDEMKRLTPLAIKPRFTEAEFRELLQPMISGEMDKLVFAAIHQRKDGSQYPAEIHLQLFKQENQSVFFAVINDISEREHAERQIQYQASLLHDVSDAIIATDQSGHIQVWNKAAEGIYGWKAEEAIGNIFHEMIKPEYRYQRREEVIENLKRDGVWSGELIHHLRDGRQIPVQSTITNLKDAAGNPAGTVSVNHDISERKHSEEMIRASLSEKEVLLQEIHHRVKNNLQIISGLLTLQADQAAGKPVEDIFRESQDRIRSIALIHEKLYQSHNLAEIAFDEYLRTLTENLFVSQGIVAGRITVKFELEPIRFTIEKAIPLGLIVNELLTNALKHAFLAGQHGQIRIVLHGYNEVKSYAMQTKSGVLHIIPVCELIVADDGIGLPAGFKPDTQKSLGMHLVSMLSQQLQAELEVKTGPGTEFRLIFSGLPTNTEGKDKDHDS
jgi:PAS domain S-box-containing protein